MRPPRRPREQQPEAQVERADVGRQVLVVRRQLGDPAGAEREVVVEPARIQRRLGADDQVAGCYRGEREP